MPGALGGDLSADGTATRPASKCIIRKRNKSHLTHAGLAPFCQDHWLGRTKDETHFVGFAFL